MFLRPALQTSGPRLGAHNRFYDFGRSAQYHLAVDCFFEHMLFSQAEGLTFSATRSFGSRFGFGHPHLDTEASKRLDAVEGTVQGK